jgi:fatty-acyl-CoA synthase/long-chain acyl-CoA synthetase
MTWGEQLARVARRRPDKPGFVFRGRQVTYGELDRRVDRVAAALAARGVGHGDRVAVLMRNRIEFLETCFAAFRLGAIAVPVNFRMVAGEAGFVLADSGAVVLVLDRAGRAVGLEARRQAPAVRTVVVVEGDAAGDEAYEDVVAEADAPASPTVLADSDPALIMYTSGTTGRPKGAVLSHFNLVMSSVSAMMSKGFIRDDEVMYLNLPLFHIGGLKIAMSSLMCEASVVVVESGRFDAAEALDDLERHAVTDCVFVSTQWRDICALRRPGLSRLALRRVAWGTSNVELETLDAIGRAFPGVPINVSFGQTEMGGLTCRLRGEELERKRGSVGLPVLHVEVRIVDEAMNDVPAGEVGEIVYRGPTVMIGYWNQPEENAAAFAGGWFHSGDLCRRDDDGYIYVVDRLKDMIISGGENVYSAEVEAAIASHPDIADVAVIGVPHPRWSETPLAVVVARDAIQPPTLETIQAHCRSRLAAYKLPTRVEVVAELPRNASGKVVKPALRARFAAMT